MATMMKMLSTEHCSIASDDQDDEYAEDGRWCRCLNTYTEDDVDDCDETNGDDDRDFNDDAGSEGDGGQTECDGTAAAGDK